MSSPIPEVVPAISRKRPAISTVDDYLKALKDRVVAEVSDNLFINSPSPWGGLGVSAQFRVGWVGTSENLFQLLVLNQRYPSKSMTREDGFQVSAEAYAAMFRAVGFPAGFPASPTTNDFWVYERSSTSDRVPTTNSGLKKSYASNIQFPVFSGFEKMFQEDLFLFSGLKKDSVDQISEKLHDAWSSMRQDIFADSWKQGSTESMFLQFLGAKPGLKLTAEQVKNVGNKDYHDLSNAIKSYNADGFLKNVLGLDSADDFFRPAGKRMYAWWSRLSNDYGSLNFRDNPKSVFFQGQTSAVAQTFSSLIQDLSNQYASAPQSNYKIYGSIESVLQATLRFYFLANYDTSPLNTHNSLPYSDSANPFVPGSFEELNQLNFKQNANIPLSWHEIYGPTWMDTFAGNEAWTDNLELNSLKKIPLFGATDQKSQEVYSGKNNVYDHGWIPTSDLEFKEISEQVDGGFDAEFKTIYFQKEDASKRSRAVRFSEDSNSSDVFTASAINGDLSNLSPESRVGRTGERIKDLGGLVHSGKVLPNRFKTYTFLGGGVDRITGSDFADVIVGTSRQNDGAVTPGSLTVYAGDGDDVVAPGRGSGVISLGDGSDQLVIDQFDTFGRTTLFDFDFDNDSLVLHKKLNAAIDINNDQFLYVFNGENDRIDEYKTLHLTQSSGVDSNQGWQVGWTDYFENYATPELKDALHFQPPELL